MTRATPAEMARRQAWVSYLYRQGYIQAQMAVRLGVGSSTIVTDCGVLGLVVRRKRNPDLPMDLIDWRRLRPPQEEKGRLARSGIITECLALLDHLEETEALFKLATLLEEEELPADQRMRLLRLQGYLSDIGKLARDPGFRREVRRDPKYRSIHDV